MSKSGIKVFVAGFLGALAGAVGGLLLAPNSGEETRKKLNRLAGSVKNKVDEETKDTRARIVKIFGSAGELSVKRYNMVISGLNRKIDDLKKAGEEIDREKYSKIVDEVLGEFRNDLRKAKASSGKLGEMLKSDFAKIKGSLTSSGGFSGKRLSKKRSKKV